MKKLLLLSLLFASSLHMNAQVEATNQINIDSLVNNVFNSGVLVNVSNVTFNNGSANQGSVQVGYFTNGIAEGLPVGEGVAMGTGNIVDALTGNFGELITDEYEDDPDINLISNGFPTNDCASIEFDVEVEADALAFNYVFLSTEYQAFTCTVFNDAFALLISGPGLDGPFSNGAVNIATIPNSDVPVSINTLNSGSATGAGLPEVCEEANPNWEEDSQYFIDNINGVVSSVQYNGFTVNLEALVEVEINQTYHMKLVICDVSDGALDSGVLLEANSFEGRFLNSVNNNRPEQLAIFPNPTTNYAQITLPESVKNQQLNVRILDMQGRPIAGKFLSGAGNAQLDVSGLEKGMYLVETSANGKAIGISKLIRD